jgi:hypothetical protein
MLSVVGLLLLIHLWLLILLIRHVLLLWRVLLGVLLLGWIVHVWVIVPTLVGSRATTKGLVSPSSKEHGEKYLEEHHTNHAQGEDVDNVPGLFVVWHRVAWPRHELLPNPLLVQERLLKVSETCLFVRVLRRLILVVLLLILLLLLLCLFLELVAHFVRFLVYEVECAFGFLFQLFVAHALELGVLLIEVLVEAVHLLLHVFLELIRVEWVTVVKWLAVPSLPVLLLILLTVI